MSDLISRSALIKKFEAEERECEDAGMVPSWWSAYKIIKEQLTAFMLIRLWWIWKNAEQILIANYVGIITMEKENVVKIAQMHL